MPSHRTRSYSFTLLVSLAAACSSAAISPPDDNRGPRGDDSEDDGGSDDNRTDAAVVDAGRDAHADARTDARADTGATVADASAPETSVSESGAPDVSAPDGGADAGCPPGGCSVDVVVPWQLGETPRVLVSDGANLFIATSGGSSVDRVPVTGGQPVVVAFDQGATVYSFTVDATNVYACSSDSTIPHHIQLWSAAKTASGVNVQQPFVSLTSNAATCRVADDGTELFLFAGEKLQAIHKVTHAVRTVVASAGSTPDDMIVDGTNVYVSSSSKVKSVSKSGATAFTTVWTASGLSPDVRHIARAGSTLFWIDGDDGLVYRLPLPSGPAQAINPNAKAPGSGPRLVADANGVYWANGYDGTVYHATVAGGSAAPIVSGLPYIQALGLDANRVYFGVTDTDQTGNPDATLSIAR